MAKILHICNSLDPAGDVVRSVAELKRHSRHQHEVAVHDRHQFQASYGFQEAELMAWNTTPEVIRNLFDWADAILFHFVGTEAGWGDMGTAKPCGFRNSNAYYNKETGKHYCAEEYSAKSVERFRLLASSHIGARDFLPGCRWLPALLDIDAPLLMPDWSPRPHCVSFSKHQSVFTGLGFRAQKLSCWLMPRARVLFERKTRATIVIDNFSDGHYGLSGLESLAQGIPVVVFNAEAAQEECRLLSDMPAPWIEAKPNPQAMRIAARNIVRMNTEEYAKLRRATRAWMERCYRSKDLIARFYDPFFDELVSPQMTAEIVSRPDAPECSIVITARNRAPLLRATLESIARQKFPSLEVIVVEDGKDNGETEEACARYGARYFLRKNRPDVPYSSPAVPCNIGLCRARGEVIILQNAECVHAGPDVIEQMVAPHRTRKNLAVFPAISARTPEGQHWHWYVHSKLDSGPRPFFFCGSVRREIVHRLRGLDEDFKFYGWDDDFFALCLQFAGVNFNFRDDIIVHHQWHPGTNCYGLQSNAELFRLKADGLLSGKRGPESNLGREWGSLDS